MHSVLHLESDRPDLVRESSEVLSDSGIQGLMDVRAVETRLKSVLARKPPIAHIFPLKLVLRPWATSSTAHHDSCEYYRLNVTALCAMCHVYPGFKCKNKCTFTHESFRFCVCKPFMTPCVSCPIFRLPSAPSGASKAASHSMWSSSSSAHSLRSS